MFNIDTLRENANLKKSKSLLRIANNGQQKMYSYLSGVDNNSTYKADNVKYILEMQGNIDWSKVSDKTNALFSIGYSDQGNIIGILTNTNALLQDMLIYCPLEEAKENLKTVLTIEVGCNKIIGKRYCVNGESPLTFALPTATQSGYKTYALVIHKAHAEKFIEIMQTIDLDALTEEDMKIIANDLSFLSRTQELAIDVAKDKTIEIVDTSEWVEAGVKPASYYLDKQNTSPTGWYAQDNLSEIINAKKENNILPEFDIIPNIPEEIKDKVIREVKTSGTLAREILAQATKDYFNNEYKDMLLYSQETSLNIKAKAMALENPELSDSIQQIIRMYRNFMLKNLFNSNDDFETNLMLSKIVRERLENFASICRNTIYRLKETAGISDYDLAMITYGTDLLHVSNEGKYFRAIMPAEFKKLYAAGKIICDKEKLFYVDDFIKDDVEDGIEYILNFKNGQAFDENGILIAKASYKYNADKAKITYDEVTGKYYAETYTTINLPPVGEEIVIPVDNFTDERIEELNKCPQEIEFTPASPNNKNILLTRVNNDVIVEGTVRFYSSSINNDTYNMYRYMLLNNKTINNMIQKKEYELINNILNNYDKVMHYKLTSIISIKEIISLKPFNEANYAIITIK